VTCSKRRSPPERSPSRRPRWRGSGPRSSCGSGLPVIRLGALEKT
jgi:hypothetical protein